ncbi:hypothetical protein GCM10011348_15830 [Marinobacterium nitratireducens]|uniref:PEGA domain-containing protein n=1 Tax=Marinobacterium nitratireducens TaxID=518897 RepID=A0A918DQG9_9GAMM|nr:PEGA domain-containing protein [Marinobacterium nitratireducens]GGO80037.1 hypothetical protein GCM10011348_15830 [Marinobacterium nitratireducens]
MKAKGIATAIMAATIVMTTGCASIVGEPTQMLSINSSPDGAKIAITDEKGISVFKGTTPTTVTLQKADGSYFGGKTYALTISKEGFESQVITIDSNPNGWFIGGNLLFGGLIGWLIVDPLTGSMYTLSPDVINGSLSPQQVSTSDDGKSLNVVLLEDLPSEAYDHLTRII